MSFYRLVWAFLVAGAAAWPAAGKAAPASADSIRELLQLTQARKAVDSFPGQMEQQILTSYEQLLKGGGAELSVPAGSRARG